MRIICTKENDTLKLGPHTRIYVHFVLLHKSFVVQNIILSYVCNGLDTGVMFYISFRLDISDKSSYNRFRTVEHENVTVNTSKPAYLLVPFRFLSENDLVCKHVSC